MQEIDIHQRFHFICCPRYYRITSPFIRLTCIVVVSVSSPAEERLLLELMKSDSYSHLTIPVSDVSQSVQANVGIILQKIIQVVRN